MKLDLRRRIALALMGLSLTVAGLVAVGLWAGHAWLENTLLDGLLSRELEISIEADTPPEKIDAEKTSLRLYRPARWPVALPPELSALNPGTYRDHRISGGHFHVLVRDLAPGDRVVLTFDVSALETGEDWLRAALLAGLLTTGLICWLASGWIASRLLRPLDSVVARIEGLRLDAPVLLAEHADDGELAVIVRAHNHLLEQLQGLVTRERAFAAAAGHELKTPLTTLRLIAGALAARPGVPAEIIARMERVLDSANQTLDALLALAGRAPEEATTPVRLDQHLPSLAEPYRSLSAAQVIYDLQDVSLDRASAALGIIFTNLLRNALRAAPSGTVQVTLRAHELSVRDDGEGICAAELAHVFEPGVHGKSGGSGMGLYISQLLAQRQGWNLRISSQAGQGTVATLAF